MTEDRNETKRRTEVKDLPRQEKELSKDEQKEIQGGTMHHIISDGWSNQTPGGAQGPTGADRGAGIDPNG